MALKAVLHSTSYNLVFANSGEEALKHLLRDDFAVILMDVQMPGLDGFETARLIRTRDKSKHIPIIFITAISQTPEHMLQGYSLGAIDYILKPFNPETLKLKIKGFATIYMEREQIKLQSELLEKQVSERTRELVLANERLRDEILERNKVTEQLRESSRRIVNILESITDAFYSLDNRWRFVYVNREAEKILMKSRNELIGKSIWDVYPQMVGTLTYREFRRAMKEKTKIHFETITLINDKWLEFHIYPSRDGLSVYYRDIDERKRAQEQLRLSEELFSKAFNGSPSMMAIKDMEGKYLKVNKNWLIITGYSPGEIVGGREEALNIWADRDTARDIQDRLEKGDVRNLEVRFRTKSEEARVGLLSIDKIKVGSEQYVLEVVTDITEHKRLVSEITRLDRLNLVGELAAGISHEVRNPMTTVRGFLQMLGDKEECGKYKNFFELMIEELDRANSIITEFLSVGRSKVDEVKARNLNDIVNALLPLIKADALGNDKYVEAELGEVPDLMLNDKEIRQVILNLARNGLEAMEQKPGGCLTIKTYAAAGEVVLSVKDQGGGIPRDIIDKIGTPFFTTKAEGTGLGLATCYGIASRHKAVVDMETGPGGTAFMFRFNIQDNRNLKFSCFEV